MTMDAEAALVSTAASWVAVASADPVMALARWASACAFANPLA